MCLLIYADIVQSARSKTTGPQLVSNKYSLNGWMNEWTNNWKYHWSMSWLNYVTLKSEITIMFKICCIYFDWLISVFKE